MTPEDEQFLKHIAANPEDDVARMAWADHLMDRDDSLGFFIAEQLRNPHISRPNSGDDPIWEFFRRFFPNEDHFPYRAGLTRRWPPIGVLFPREGNPLGLAWFYFERGLPARVKCLEAWWRRHGPWVVTRFPLEYVLIANREPQNQMLPPYLDSTMPRQKLWYLSGSRGELGYALRGQTFFTKNEVMKALSDVCLAWARREKLKCAKRRRKKS